MSLNFGPNELVCIPSEPTYLNETNVVEGMNENFQHGCVEGRSANELESVDPLG